MEPCARAGKIAELAPEVFSPLELAQLDALREDEKLDRALRLWTLKESYIKARGMGLSLPLKKFSFLFGGAEGIRLELDPDLNDQPERWRFCLLDHAGHRIALMAERAAAPELQIWEVHPLGATPARLAVVRRYGIRWCELLLRQNILEHLRKRIHIRRKEHGHMPGRNVMNLQHVPPADPIPVSGPRACPELRDRGPPPASA